MSHNWVVSHVNILVHCGMLIMGWGYPSTLFVNVANPWLTLFVPIIPNNVSRFLSTSSTSTNSYLTANHYNTD